MNIISALRLNCLKPRFMLTHSHARSLTRCFSTFGLVSLTGHLPDLPNNTILSALSALRLSKYTVTKSASLLLLSELLKVASSWSNRACVRLLHDDGIDQPYKSRTSSKKLSMRHCTLALRSPFRMNQTLATILLATIRTLVLILKSDDAQSKQCLRALPNLV